MTKFSFFRLLLALPVFFVMGSCARVQPEEISAVQSAPPASVTSQPENLTEQLELQDDGIPMVNLDLAEVWLPLLTRLAGDGIEGPEIEYLFVRLGPAPSQEPMGRKVEELYTNAFIRKPKKPSQQDTEPSTSAIPKPWYKGVVTDANARRCRNFLNTYAEYFEAAEEKYKVPKEIAVSLLFVETRLGDYLGKHNAFETLASMAASTSPEFIPDWISKLPDVDKRMDWVSERMQDKSTWAYNELRALLRYSMENGIDPLEVPSSFYGAIGLCQFMPSNLAPYADDGNEDGIIDLFNPADAIFSLSLYLSKHGWKEDTTAIADRRKVLKRYNNLNIYANTIMALAEKIAEIPGRPTVNRPLPLPPQG